MQYSVTSRHITHLLHVRCDQAICPCTNAITSALCLTALVLHPVLLCSAAIIPVVFNVSFTLCFCVWYVVRPRISKSRVMQRAPTWLRALFSDTREPTGLSSNTRVDGDNSSNKSGLLSTRFARYAVAAALVITFEFYSVAASTALSMLMCIGVPSASESRPDRYRWIVDVRLQCPAMMQQSAPWAVGAVMLGSILLVVCIFWPIFIATVLLRKAVAGRLGYDSVGGSGQHNSTEHFSITHYLAFRYADYSVNCDGFKQDDAKPCGADKAAQSGWQRLSALRVRMYACLVWDSVLDLQRFVLALLALCVMLHELHQLLLMTVVLGLYLMVILVVRPWRSNTVWLLQVGAASVLVFSCCTIMACHIGDTSSHYSNDEASKYQKVLPFVVIGLNLAYTVVGAAVLACCMWRKHIRTLAGRLSKSSESVQGLEQV